ncbi:MAG: CocE/NonD family hydrolase, partial [Gammaproteobacteria bacterium]
AGPVYVVLSVQSNCRDTDFIAKLIELEADGSATLLMDGIVRVMFRDATSEPQYLEPDQIYETRINLAQIHHTFRAGSCIQIDITSSNFPRRARNTNSGNMVLARDDDSDIHIATNTIHHGVYHPSYVELPMLPD